MDKIFIRGLKVDTIIGVYDWERTLQRPLIFDLEMGADFNAAAASDHVRDAIDYAAVMETVQKISTDYQPALLEALAEKLARSLFNDFPILSLKLTIHKPGAIPVQDVGVEIDRRREDYAACGAR
ncbi:dihydroneopterin aldolase [Hydrocarboniphaga sp.]|uniref:dihydroneopterin aldolase n=1 Tax=Hydrocarboniphaga sp. TaxID=2033016 RepID=UPI003D102216